MRTQPTIQLRHWAWIVPLLMIVSVLAIHQIDLYAPTLDEFYSMNNAGGVVDTPYTPSDVLGSLAANSPQHVPGYFLLLSLWGNAISWDIAILRLLAVFAGILSIAMSYRLMRDLLTPASGFVAAVVMASNTFYNFYYAHVRMYPFLVLFAMLVLWLYLRIQGRQGRNRLVDYGALTLSCYALINTHILSVIFLATIGIYHLLFVRKDRRWWAISTAVTLAVVLFSPYLTVIFSGFGHAVTVREGLTVDGLRAVEVWLTVAFNNNVTLLGLVLVGIYFAYRNQLAPVKSYLIMLPIYLLLLALTAQVAHIIVENGMRYLVAGYALLVPVVGIGLIGLIRHSRWTWVLIVLWMLAGLSFQRSTDNWAQYIADRFIAFEATPFHVVSRTARTETIKPFVVGYQNTGDSFFRDGRFGVAFVDYFFGQYGVPFSRFRTLDDAQTHLEQESVALPSVWLTYQQSEDVQADIEAIQATMSENYTRCDTQAFGVNSIIERYVWDFLACDLPNAHVTDSAGTVDYTFYTAMVNADASRLWFVDQWQSSDASGLNMSYQLLTANWENVAQIDLPLVHEGKLRRFALDIGTVPSGTYRLIAVLYNTNTGERFEWNNTTSDPRDVLTLTEIVIE